MLRVHVYTTAADTVRTTIHARDPERTVVALANRRDLEAALPEIQALIAGIPPREGWAGARALRMIQVMGAGVDMLLPSPDLPSEVIVANARGLFAAESAEFAIAALLSLVRDLPRIVGQARERQFRQFASPKLEGSTLTVLGLGEIGRRVARIGRALGSTVIGVSRGARPCADADETHSIAALDDVLPRSQHLVIALPKTPETTNLLDARRLALLPPGARLVAISRGGIVDEAALAKLLAGGRLAGAALDVFAREPLPESSPLWSTPNTIVSPHVAGYGERYVERVAELFVENVRRLERGEPIATPVDRAAGY
jgi:phosphoglycerate dehydrogenase-like enzyme